MFGLLLSVSISAEQKFSADELKSRTIERRAVEAVIWGMPAVNYDLMLQEMLAKTPAKVNEIIYWSKPAEWKNQTLTPNPDAIYLMIFFNTKDGPVVIDVPPADTGSFAANIDDVWQMPLADAGPEGSDAGKGGKYLVLPPDYKGDVPEGYFALRSFTYGGFALFRSNLPSHSEADVAKARDYGKRLKVYPLSKAANPGETKFTDAKDVLFDSTIKYDASFFTNLDYIVQTEPWLARDMAMIDPLKSLGIEKGKPFNPDAKTVDALNAAASEAREFLDQKYEALGPFFPGRRWTTPATPAFKDAIQSGYADVNSYPIDARGVIYTVGFIGIKKLGTAQFYLINFKDKAGNQLDGNKTYRLPIPADPPVKQYWSVTAYDRQTHALIKNLDRASRASNATEVQKNSDGSVDIYFGPKALAGKESNWVPTDPKRPFEVLFRAYGPKKELFEKTWALPDFEEVK
ncbi:MAG TPA: DUF1254 domain-containing protein [Pyrinomonadaceae bacterium]|nr:DUF1254 domain-containing protein [Pyrinomonadaceae bacterium]